VGLRIQVPDFDITRGLGDAKAVQSAALQSAWRRRAQSLPAGRQARTQAARTYFAHVLLHDCGNPYDIGRRMLLDWGMDDDRVLFWPFWSNGDVVRTGNPEVKASAWTLSAGDNQRLLLLVMNYDREQTADVTVSANLTALGIVLVEGQA
jgi:hypothetical protein